MKKSVISNKSLINNLSNQLFYDGKKNYVFGVLLSSLQYFYKKKPLSTLNILISFLYKNRPILETREIRKGSVFYQVPFFIKNKRSCALILKWLSKTVKLKSHGPNLKTNILKELKSISINKGNTFSESKKLKELVSNNIMHSHYRWR
jgi:ribosomal protein S7